MDTLVRERLHPDVQELTLLRGSCAFVWNVWSQEFHALQDYQMTKMLIGKSRKETDAGKGASGPNAQIKDHT
jgi:hypothetical protein